MPTAAAALLALPLSHISLVPWQGAKYRQSVCRHVGRRLEVGLCVWGGGVEGEKLMRCSPKDAVCCGHMHCSKHPVDRTGTSEKFRVSISPMFVEVTESLPAGAVSAASLASSVQLVGVQMKACRTTHQLETRGRSGSRRTLFLSPCVKTRRFLWPAHNHHHVHSSCHTHQSPSLYHQVLYAVHHQCTLVSLLP